MVTSKTMLASVLSTAFLVSGAWAGQVAPPSNLANILHSIGEQERSVFAADGASLLGGFLDVRHTTAVKAARLYAENEVAADRQLYRQNVLLSGTVFSINSGLGNVPYIVLAAPTALQVQARLADEATDEAATLKKGQKVILFCRGAGAVAGSPVFRNCLFAEYAANVKWAELTREVSYFYQGQKPTSMDVVWIAGSASTIAELISPNACTTAGPDCRSAVFDAMRHKDFKSQLAATIDAFKKAGLTIPSR
ncbi:hypothetical protein FOB29_00375 [Bordetella hinzii]|nr:hypothetical protein FOB29_00375 [Bordetella hinzii]